MSATAPALWWVRRDLRLDDNAALMAAVGRGGPVLVVFIRDTATRGLGAAPRWRLGLGLAALERSLRAAGSGLVLRSGSPVQVLRALVAETGARAVYWSRAYEAGEIARDRQVKAALVADGIEARSLPGPLLFEPWTVATGRGGPFRVYTPFWKAVRARQVTSPVPAPGRIAGPDTFPVSETLAGWQLGAGMNRGAAIVSRHLAVGEEAARARLERFLDSAIGGYKDRRDYPAESATSRLSENLAWGEISPARLWHAGQRAMAEGAAGAEHFLKELVWREFAWHLLHHTPHIATGNWRPEWDGFPWRADNADAERWRRGLTGVPFVDAAMREMYVTGTMHNRGRMIVASFLTKHLMTHWKVGLDWFADCLVDWDPASNAMGWQWAAGSGPDAAPYFRIFNPDTQAERFDPDRRYRRRFIAELSRPSPAPDTAQAYFRAVPRSWGLDPAAPYPSPVVDLAAGRARALAAWEARNLRSSAQPA